MARAKAAAEILPPSVDVPSSALNPAPVKIIDPENLRVLGYNLDKLFTQYAADRLVAEERWLRNLRQYLGIYDPDVIAALSPNRSRAYPRITRVKCVSTLSRIMSLMFPGNERNWTLKASPEPDMSEEDIKEALATALQKDQTAGITPGTIDLEYAKNAVQQLADERAKDMSNLIDDQLQELGGDQTYDYVALNREVVQSGILYGIGLLAGPYVRKTKGVVWEKGAKGGLKTSSTTQYKPFFEFLRVWDYYPDLSAKTFKQMDGHFTRKVMSRSQVKDLTKNKEFFADMIEAFLKDNSQGNYKPQNFETQLRTMGIRVNVNEAKPETAKYEIRIWHGKVNGQYLALAGCEVADDKLTDHIDAEIWMIGNNVIRANINPWIEVGIDVDMIHEFLFDKDDTSPLGSGLPNTIRDSQMGISAATRMLMDNASVVCGPNIEINTDLLRADQDLGSTSAYKIWYREGMGQDAQFPAVRNLEISSHIDDLMKIVDMFLKFADMETFVNPATGGDMSKGPSEPYRTAAGASMLRGDAALPFKDIVRSFDGFTQSVIQSLVFFNKVFNPKRAPLADYNVIARGATSLMAQEVRGIQLDQLVSTLTDEERVEINMRKLAAERLKVRDLDDLLLTVDEAARAKAQRDQAAQQQQTAQQQLQDAEVRKLTAGAFKDMSQGQKNIALADIEKIKSTLELLSQGITNDPASPQSAASGAGPSGASPTPTPGQSGGSGDPGAAAGSVAGGP